MSAPRKATALFGGTFDPVHNGHIRMAIEVRERLSVPRVVLIPASVPPHKPRQPVTDARHRLAMAAAAARGIPGLEVSDVEIRRGGPSWSIDTVAAFREMAPDAELLFLIGEDAFAEIETWHRYGELLASCDFVLLPRPGSAGAPGPPRGPRLEKAEPHCYSWEGESFRLPGGRMLYCPRLPALDIASRVIREKVRQGKSIRGLVPDEVERYIAIHGLYTASGEDERP